MLEIVHLCSLSTFLSSRNRLYYVLDPKRDGSFRYSCMKSGTSSARIERISSIFVPYSLSLSYCLSIYLFLHLEISTVLHTKYSTATELSTYSHIDFYGFHQRYNSPLYTTLSTHIHPETDVLGFPEQHWATDLDTHFP